MWKYSIDLVSLSEEYYKYVTNVRPRISGWHLLDASTPGTIPLFRITFHNKFTGNGSVVIKSIITDLNNFWCNREGDGENVYCLVGVTEATIVDTAGLTYIIERYVQE